MINASRSPLLGLFRSQQATSRREQLCATLRLAIANGSLRLNEKLPSSRQLAADLALSRVTVEAAYARLESEGYLRRQTGRGTFVAITLPPARAAAAIRNTGTLPLSARGEKISLAGGCQDPPLPVAFAAGSPDLRTFPHDQWRKLSTQVMRSTPSGWQGYGDPQGLLALREALARHLNQSRGLRCAPQHIVILTSSQQALQMLSLLLLDPDDRVWLEDPGYPGARQAFYCAGARLEGLRLDDEGAQILAARSAPRLVYLTPSHQYPTGVALTLTRRLAWLDYARLNHCWLIEDDYDSEFWFDEMPMPAMQGLDRSERVITLGTFSKSLFPSLRLAWMVVPDALVEPLCRLRSVLDGHSAQLMQAVTAEFINRGYYSAHLRYMRQLYASRQRHLCRLLTEKCGDLLAIDPHHGGLQLSVTLKFNADDRQLSQRAAAAGLSLIPLSPLALEHENRRQGFILGYAALTPAEIGVAVSLLATLLESARSA
ncbi:GntR family transcriptional regulator [Izhakiella australiensis]|uniref:GntR family transcriptional regulator n=1 Tax=Izhakiella australiensis TaxID=1926881 RepID=A0A1S8YJN9_9GAMM|nr:PLP-dependent aminotransferase family protein [Izhakiella australiensis]OON39108.1 GntR family transcriptional regulator [Izhakiella australiensis]